MSDYDTALDTLLRVDILDAARAEELRAAIAPLRDRLAEVEAPDMRRGAFVLVTRLTHASGQWFESLYPLPSNGGPQQLGSAITYARRYALAAMLSVVADEDDDGEVAKDATASVKQPPKAHRPDPEVLADTSSARASFHASAGKI